MSEMVVIETADDHFLGTLSIENNMVRVNTHRVGHPTFLAIEDIVRITPANEHPLVEGSDPYPTEEPHTDSLVTRKYARLFEAGQ